MYPATGTLRALVCPLLLGAVALALFGCGTAPSSSSSSSTDDPTETSASSTSSTSLPSPGSVIRLVPTDQAVPAGKLLEVTAYDPRGGVSEYFLLDPHARRGYREMASPCPTPGHDITIADNEGHREMDGVTLEVYPDPPAGQKSADYEAIMGEDYLGGQEATVTGSELYEGQETIVAETTLTVPEGPSTEISVNIDPATGLRVREKAALQSQVYVTERRILDATPDLLIKLDKDSIREMAAEFLKEREQKLYDLPYPARGFAEGTEDLSLLWILPGRDWTSVRLEYQSPATRGRPAVTVITYDLAADSKAAHLFTVSLEKAAPLTEEGSDLLRFRQGDTGVQVQSPAGTGLRMARELVVVGGPGSKWTRP